MEEAKKPGSHLTSAAAFVEGGIQEACDDACSICLEEFCESDPSAATTCKHEFHLQCILEWCQRSSDCPMCLRPISLKDPISQELFEAVERERNIRAAPVRNTAIFHHPALGNFELHNLHMGSNDAELEERIFQHLAAAAAMGRAHQIGRREGPRNQTSAHGHPHFLVFSNHPGGPPSRSVSSVREDSARLPVGPMTPDRNELSHHISQFPLAQTAEVSSTVSGSTVVSANHQEVPSNIRISTSHSQPSNRDRAGPSEFQSFSDNLKSRFNAVSMRYKESISKSTRGWKERLFSRSSSMSELGSEVQREVSAGIASVSRFMDRTETRDEGRANQGSSVTEQDSLNNGETPFNEGSSTPVSSATH